MSRSCLAWVRPPGPVLRNSHSAMTISEANITDPKAKWKSPTMLAAVEGLSGGVGNRATPTAPTPAALLNRLSHLSYPW